MLLRSRTLALLLGLGFLWILTGFAVADKEDAERIDKLIEQLGSGSFQEREAATKALDAIGGPALEKLRKATQGDDAEVKRRATDLVKRIEKRAEISRVLTPKRVHLVYKGTPVKEAVEDFKKKSGYDLLLHDPDNKLADRKMTLDTGETTFWEALDKFCDAAGLSQTSQQDMMMQMMQEQMRGAVQPKVPPPLPPAKKPAAKDAPPQPAPPKDEKPAAPPKPEGAAKDDEGRAAAQAKARAVQEQAAARAERAAVIALAQVAAPPQAGVARPGGIVGPGGRGVPATSPDQIVLVDGKRKTPPTHYAGTVRVRAAEPMQQPPGDEAPLLVNLQIATEPKFQLRGIASTRITKAVDDQGQSLSQINLGDDADVPVIANFAPARPLRGGGAIRMGMPYMIPGSGSTTIPLKKGEKPSKTLKELSGTLTLQVLDAPEALISVDNVLKAGATTTKGKAGGEIKVVEAIKTERGEIKVRVELDLPPDVVPAGQQGYGGGMMMPAFRVKLAVPAVPPAIAPPAAAPPAEKPKDGAPKDEKPQAKAPAKEKPAAPPPVAAPAIAVAQVAVAGQDFFARQPNYPGDVFQGLKLVDANGKSFKITMVRASSRALPAGSVATEYELIFELGKDQGEPAKLIFSGSKIVTVEVPFTLKDVAVR